MKIEHLKAFAAPYYENKDIMHNLWHIELVYKSVLKLVQLGEYKVDIDILTTATFFHGFIKSNEADIRIWLADEGFSKEFIKKAVNAAFDSHTDAIPSSIEGKIIHDAHLIEGGKTYIITKCLITGSLRGQSLPETIAFIENNIIGNRSCYLPESTPLFKEAELFTREFLADLKNGLEL